jgi:hypothetical protein
MRIQNSLLIKSKEGYRTFSKNLSSKVTTCGSDDPRPLMVANPLEVGPK